MDNVKKLLEWLVNPLNNSTNIKDLQSDTSVVISSLDEQYFIDFPLFDTEQEKTQEALSLIPTWNKDVKEHDYNFNFINNNEVNKLLFLITFYLLDNKNVYVDRELFQEVISFNDITTLNTIYKNINSDKKIYIFSSRIEVYKLF